MVKNEYGYGYIVLIISFAILIVLSLVSVKYFVGSSDSGSSNTDSYNRVMKDAEKARDNNKDFDYDKYDVG